jgi:hypothetical protein
MHAARGTLHSAMAPRIVLRCSFIKRCRGEQRRRLLALRQGKQRGACPVEENSCKKHPRTRYCGTCDAKFCIARQKADVLRCCHQSALSRVAAVRPRRAAERVGKCAYAFLRHMGCLQRAQHTQASTMAGLDRGQGSACFAPASQTTTPQHAAAGQGEESERAARERESVRVCV